MNNYFTVDYIILGCLSIEPMSGYDIKRLISISTSLFYNASYGSIYPTLKKMEEADWWWRKKLWKMAALKKSMP